MDLGQGLAICMSTKLSDDAFAASSRTTLKVARILETVSTNGGISSEFGGSASGHGKIYKGDL